MMLKTAFIVITLLVYQQLTFVTVAFTISLSSKNHVFLLPRLHLLCQKRSKYFHHTRTTTTSVNSFTAKIENSSEDNDNNNNNNNAGDDATTIIERNKEAKNQSRSMMTSISEKLNQALDIRPILEGVARYTGTKRGHDAILSLLEDDDPISSKEFSTSRSIYNTPKRKATISSIVPNTKNTKNTIKATRQNHDNNNYRYIIKISQSIHECRHEWKLIQEAMNILKQTKCIQNDIALPPIYPQDSSLWNTNDKVDTDDDEWLEEIIYGRGWNTNDLELENILQADQLVNRILKTYEWCKVVKDFAPMISKIGERIDHDKLMELDKEIKGSVIIVKGQRSYQDPSGTKSYQFELDPLKFPIISILREKEDKLLKSIDIIAQTIMTSNKFISYQSKVDGNPGPFILNGRVVLAVNSKDFASKIGIIRSNVGSLVYVEPNEIIKIGDELVSIREEIASVKNQVCNHLSSVISRSAVTIQKGLDEIALIDVLFARAAFGDVLNGQIPLVGDHGCVINVENFIHPVLALNKENTVAVDLVISNNSREKTLIISGPNAGGKTLALKSFGLVAMMNRLAIPIPTNNLAFKDTKKEIRVDFFHDIFVEIGDNQNILNGESTYIAKLNSISKIIEKVFEASLLHERNSIILLDELGDGTDPEAGGCIAQAILEQLLESDNSVTIATTHSSRLKALSLTDRRVAAASVLLSGSSFDSMLPTYELQYGSSGLSHTLHAASRINPKFPKHLLDRAAYLISSSQDSKGEEIKLLSEALERERYLASHATDRSRKYENDIKKCRDALILLTRSYDQQLSRLEDKLESMYQILKNDDSNNAYDIVGDSLSTVRIVKKKVKTIEEQMKERGLRIISDTDVFHGGEIVIIIEEGYFDGVNAIVSEDQSTAAQDELIVDIDDTFDWIGFDQNSTQSALPSKQIKLTMKKRYLAVWDYPDEYFELDSTSAVSQARSVQDSRSRLFETLNSLNASSKSLSRPTNMKQNNNEKKFTSSRERKAAAKSSKKQKK